MEEMLAALQQMEETLKALPPLALSQLDKGRSAVFTVDMNIGFARQGALASPRTDAKTEAAAGFLARCRAEGLPVYAITDTHPADSPEFDAYPPHCVEGTEECQVLPELMPFVDRVFPKSSTNALFAPEVLDCCRQYDTIVVTGCCTDICIHQFVVGLKAWANQQGKALEVLVPVSLCDTFDAPGHPAQLMNLVFFQSMAANGAKLFR